MALIKCPECSAKISDKARCCPKCGAPVAFKLDNIDIYSFSDSQPSMSKVAKGKNNVDTTPAFVSKNKRNLVVLITCLVIVFIVTIVFAAISQNGSSSNKKTNLNRTQENCTFLGTANVYPALHANGNCVPDGDGYFYPGFGHHHHK